jgi:hypothetical protein
MTQIKNRYSDEIIHECDFETFKDCVEDAVRKGTSLAYANLKNANLYDADLAYASLYRANLENANLKGANLAGANLYYANLKNANLALANLKNANLENADLEGANLAFANLKNANLENAKMPDKPIVLPPVGETIVGFKKLRYDIVIKVGVPADADRVSTWINRKCRASALRVIEVMQNPDNIPTDCMPGWRNQSFAYKLGELHHPDQFDPDERLDCHPGLHFFMTLEEAMKWYG